MNRCWSVFVYFVLIVIGSVFILDGCSSTQPQISDKQLQAIEMNQKAGDAFKKGNYLKALNHYEEALQISRSLENPESMGNNIINIAYVYLKLGNKESAHSYVDQIIDGIPFRYSSTQTTEALFLKALIYYEEQKEKEATAFADKALALCLQESCASEGRIYNLKARIATLRPDNNTAMGYAERGMAFNKKINDNEEIANSMRIIAGLMLAGGQYETARRYYSDAFSLDKTLELSEKMIKDLVGIAYTYEKQGKRDDAMQYFRRALSISEGTKNRESIRKIKDLIEKQDTQR